MENYTAALLLADGTVFYGKSIGVKGTSAGEICFNTGMTGYQEIYTDPSYFGQIVVNTNAHIGNYGALASENESKSVKISGLVVRGFSSIHSRSAADSSLQKYLEQANVVGIAEVDTRKIVRHIREKGAMNALITTEIENIEAAFAKLKEVPDMAGLELSSLVSTTEPYFVGKEDAPFKVAVLDLGIKASILHHMASRGCYCKVFPAKTSFEKMQEWNPNGYFISNGPGDPAVMTYAIDTVKAILEKNAPVFGICLGHQILAQASGVSTYKMHHGHRGLNHPVKNLITGRSEVTSQNHGFSVKAEDVAKNPHVEVTHINLNDNTIEGIRLTNKKAFSVQYHPESSPGPHDSRYLFDQFIDLMK